MKVKDLEKGMLLKPCQGFRIIAGSWLRVEINQKRYPTRRWADRVRPKESPSFALYVGTKKDVGESAESWSNRYVLYNNKIFPVDPSSWRHLQPANQ